MIPENVVLDFQDPLKPYKSCNGLLGKALSGSVYQKAFSYLIAKTPSNSVHSWLYLSERKWQIFLKPCIYTPASHFCRRKQQAKHNAKDDARPKAKAAYHCMNELEEGLNEEDGGKWKKWVVWQWKQHWQ